MTRHLIIKENARRDTTNESITYMEKCPLRGLDDVVPRDGDERGDEFRQPGVAGVNVGGRDVGHAGGHGRLAEVGRGRGRGDAVVTRRLEEVVALVPC